MSAHHLEPRPCRLWNLFAQVHKLATGNELSIEDAANYFGDPKHLALLVEQSGILDDAPKRETLEMILSEHRNGI